MNRVTAIACCVVWVAGGYSSPAKSQAQALPPGLAGLKIIEPEPERAGDRALSCAQITREIGLIMQKRNVSQAAASAKRKVCSSKKVLDRQVDEKKKLQAAQTPALIAAGLTPGPTSTAILTKVNADTLALEQRQQPGRQQAQGEMLAGVGDMMSAFNDPRLMRLAMLAQEHQCAQSMPPPPSKEPAEECDDSIGSHDALAIPRPEEKQSSGPPDPFAPRATSTPVTPGASAASSSFVKPDPFTRR